MHFLPHHNKSFFARISPLLTIAFVALLFIAGAILFSYLIVFGIILGAIYFLVSYVRLKWRTFQAPSKQKSSSTRSGRIIEHDENL